MDIQQQPGQQPMQAPQPQAGAPAPPQSAGTQAQMRQGALAKLNAHFSKVGEAVKAVSQMKSEFAALSAMGDAVSEDDLVKASAAIVAHGADPRAVASMLADSPTNGQQLAGWIAQKLQGFEIMQQKLQQVREQSRTQLLGASLGHFASTLHENIPGPQPMAGLNPGALGGQNGGQ